jgi:hypothetical protein
MNGIPKSVDEFEIWTVSKMGEIMTNVTALHTKLDIVLTHHQAQLDEVKGKIETRERWGRIQHVVNGVMIPINLFIHAVLNKFGIHI